MIIELDAIVDDRLKPLGYTISSLERELWLCDLALKGVCFKRLSDWSLEVDSANLIKIVLFYPNPYVTVAALH